MGNYYSFAPVIDSETLLPIFASAGFLHIFGTLDANSRKYAVFICDLRAALFLYLNQISVSTTYNHRSRYKVIVNKRTHKYAIPFNNKDLLLLRHEDRIKPESIWLIVLDMFG